MSGLNKTVFPPGTFTLLSDEQECSDFTGMFDSSGWSVHNIFWK